jgi:hypothetical protein
MVGILSNIINSSTESTFKTTFVVCTDAYRCVLKQISNIVIPKKKNNGTRTCIPFKKVDTHFKLSYMITIEVQGILILLVIHGSGLEIIFIESRKIISK